MTYAGWIMKSSLLVSLSVMALLAGSRGGTSTNPRGLKRSWAPDLTAWLAEHPQVASAIVWETPDSALSYPDWSEDRKARLLAAFSSAWNSKATELVDPPPNIAELIDDVYPTTVLAETNAWLLFVAYVAQGLAIDIGKRTAWSVSDYSCEDLAILFESRSMFSWHEMRNGYEIELSHGFAVPAPPDYTFHFLSDNGILANDKRQTIVRLLNWCRVNLVHFEGGRKTKDMKDQWQYEGYPPVSRVIEGTPFSGRPQEGTSHRTAGCWGTTGFLRAVLRAVNIPVSLVYVEGHALPAFTTEGLYLSHGDDPYVCFSKATPPFPADELLINQKTYDNWFGSEVPDEIKLNNVGRRPEQLAVEYLPDCLLEMRCFDIAVGQSHSDGAVYNALKRNLSVVELEASRLWIRLDEKIMALGGCGHIQ